MTFRNGLDALLRHEDPVVVQVDRHVFQPADSDAARAVVKHVAASSDLARPFTAPTILPGAIAGRGTQPAHIVRRPHAHGVKPWLTSHGPKRAVADPRLEALRALSVAVSRCPANLDDALVAMVRDAGWTVADLELLLPTYDWRTLPEPVQATVNYN